MKDWRERKDEGQLGRWKRYSERERERVGKVRVKARLTPKVSELMTPTLRSEHP